MRCDIAVLSVEQAATAWLDSRKNYISPKTFHEYRLNIKPLARFFGEQRLSDITDHHVRSYQHARLKECGPFAINHECCVLVQMRKRIGSPFKDYQPLPLPKEPRGRALSDEEKKRLFQVSQANANWEAAYCFAMISVNTTAGPKEAMTLRLKDLDLERRILRVQPEGAKNIYRARPIPLNDDAFEASRLAVQRARRVGAISPEHYVFPFRINRKKFDPNRHQTTFKTAWKRMTTAAGLQSFRMYDLRHHAITELLENPEVSEETAESIAGHISHAMKRRYSHVRIETKRAAVNLMNRSIRVAELMNEDVIALLAEFPAEIVTAKIQASACRFDTSIDTLRKLKGSGVPQSVILAMVKAS